MDKIKQKLKLIEDTKVELHNLIKEKFPVGTKLKYGDYRYEVTEYDEDIHSILYNCVHVDMHYKVKDMNGRKRIGGCTQEHWIENVLKWKVDKSK